MTITVGRCLKRKTMLVWVKEHIIKNFATCKTFCNLQELYTAFKEKHPNVNIELSKFCAMRPKYGVFWLAQKWLTLFALVALIKMLWTLVDAINWDLIEKNWSRRSFATQRAANVSCINPDLALQHWTNFLIRNSTNMKMMRNLITVSGTLHIEQYWQAITNNTKRLWLMLLMI